ncbi:MAG: flagellar biosynthesis protein FlhA [Chloroflexota bacterium]
MAVTSVNSKRNPTMGRVMAQSDVMLAAAVIGIVAMMVIPLPADVLDVLQVVNIAAALTILLVSMYVMEPLEFSVFPSLLLITTLFRLALNVSATRLILLNGSAGHVIEAFGSFVVGGNYVVGVVVFLILVVIQFVVITNGAGRIAEVAARFTLDAMPGKQMSIDADMNAGLITETEARRRRRAIESEADFYGAMDGASKFVKGDAVAGIIIIVINIVGGFVIGVLQRGMSLMDSVGVYTLLTVGDGLVTQIPALLISTATGIVVTRSASESDLGSEMASQILANPRVLGIVAGIMGAFALVPALPKLPFLGAAAVLGGVAWAIGRGTGAVQELPEEVPVAGPADQESPSALLQVDPMEVEIGYGLISMVEQKPGGMLARITAIRRQLAQELGIVVPTVRIRDNLQLGPNSYLVKLRGVEIGRGELMASRFLALGMGWDETPLEGVKTSDPAFGLPAMWIGEADRERAEGMGYTVVDSISVFSTHFTEIVKTFAPVILGRQDLQLLLDTAKASYPAVLEELIPNIVTAGEVHRVLQNLLRERVSVRNLGTILEALAVEGRATRDPDLLSEAARRALGREICSLLKAPDGSMHVITIGPEAEQLIANALHGSDRTAVVALEPGVAHRMLQQLGLEIQRVTEAGYLPVILCSGRIRLPLKRLTERSMPNLVVLSFAEIPSDFKVECEATVTLGLDG